MKKVIYVTELISKWFCLFSVAALLVMVFVTIADVFLRNFFNSPLTGSVEIARMMFICMSPAFVYTLIKRRHIQIPLFVDLLGRKGQLAFDTFGYLATAAICGMMFYRGILLTFTRRAQNHVYSMLKIPTWPFILLFAVAMGIFALVILICLVDNFLDKNRYVKKPKRELGAGNE